jgi:hypothetical protein
LAVDTRPITRVRGHANFGPTQLSALNEVIFRENSSVGGGNAASSSSVGFGTVILLAIRARDRAPGKQDDRSAALCRLRRDPDRRVCRDAV